MAFNIMRPSESSSTNKMPAIIDLSRYYTTLCRGNESQCMADWDSSTHMTKGEWNQVCRRVVGDRVRFKMQYEPNQPTMKQN